MTAFDVPPAYPSWVEGPGGFWINDPEAKELTFSVKEVAEIFFRMSSSWLRMRMQPSDNERHPFGWFTEEDITRPIMINREQGRVETYDFRRFTLYNVERMIWSMYRHEIIELVWWYTSHEQTGKRGQRRLARYNEQAAESLRKLAIRIDLIRALGRLYDLIPSFEEPVRALEAVQ